MTADLLDSMTDTDETIRPFGAMFRADWREALFIHFQVEPAILQAIIPLEPDLYDGCAYVSLVAFTQKRLRPCVGGALSAWLSGPLASHEFLNLRTYVRRGEERGIYFLSEWIPNRLAVFLGPRLYGLPYRLGQLSYSTDEAGRLTREVVCEDAAFRCIATREGGTVPAACIAGSEAAFLLERYTAFTCRRGVLRRFRIQHEPWLAEPAKVAMERRDLIGDLLGTEPVAAHYSEGVLDVGIGRPERVISDREPQASIPARRR